MIPGYGLAVMLVCVLFYYRLGEAEDNSGLAIAGLSLVLWLGGSYMFHLGLLGRILTQVLLFAGLQFGMRLESSNGGSRVNSEGKLSNIQ